MTEITILPFGIVVKGSNSKDVWFKKPTTKHLSVFTFIQFFAWENISFSFSC